MAKAARGAVFGHPPDVLPPGTSGCLSSIEARPLSWPRGLAVYAPLPFLVWAPRRRLSPSGSEFPQIIWEEGLDVQARL